MKEKDVVRKIGMSCTLILLVIFPVLVCISGISSASNDFTIKWTAVTGLNGCIGPITKDVNGDGIDEIFMAGLQNPSGPQGRIVCLNGLTGNIIWAKDFKVGYTDRQVPLAIGDLNHNGIYEVVQTADTRTIARYATNGTEFWNVSVPSGWHQFVIADTDKNGYPYVYVVYHCDGAPYTAKLSKLYGRNGTVAAQVGGIYHPCYGGISCADINNDGRYEILLSDRAGGKGMQCYDDNLNLLWYNNEITCSTHCLILVNVTGDSKLEVIGMKYSSEGSETGGIYVLNADGTKVPGKCSQNLGLACHVQPAVYDIDNDGNLELITCYHTHPKVWDLGRWALDVTLTDIICWEPPDFANVVGDSNLEIIACNGTMTKIYDSSYQCIDTLYGGSYCSVVQDIDNDGLNEMILLENNSLIVYDTLAHAPTPRVRTDTPFYSERRTDAGVYVPPIGSGQQNSPPSTPRNPVPSNYATNQSLTVDLGWTGGDPDPGDTVLYDVYFGTASSPPKVKGNQSTLAYDPGMLAYQTMYYWKIVAWDTHGAKTSGPIWRFTTLQNSISWWNTQWSYRKVISINHNKVKNNFVDFPVLIHLTDTDLASKAQSSANDIVFTSKTGIKLYHEIESYTSSTGELIAWVRVPSLSNITDTLLCMYYGNPSATIQQNVEGTWDTHFVGVWHMNDASTTTVKDSTVKHNNGTKKGPGEPYKTPAFIGNGQGYDGVDDQVNAGYNSVLAMNTFTASVWIKPQRFAWCNMILGKYSSTSLGEWYLSFSNKAPYNKLRVVLIDSNGQYHELESATSITMNTWTHVDVVYNGTLAFYINGVKDGHTLVLNKNLRHSGNVDVVIGNNQYGWYPFKGMLDEVCLSNVARAGGWISTSYNNQNNPAGFYSIGNEESK